MSAAGGVSGSGGVGAEAEDLLVFGYACKVYRDDNRALQAEKALIPWMGDELISIDRRFSQRVSVDITAHLFLSSCFATTIFANSAGCRGVLTGCADGVDGGGHTTIPEKATHTNGGVWLVQEPKGPRTCHPANGSAGPERPAINNVEYPRFGPKALRELREAFAWKGGWRIRAETARFVRRAGRRRHGVALALHQTWLLHDVVWLSIYELLTTTAAPSRRYDGRGHLSSLEEFEPRAGIWEQHWNSLGPVEAAEEQMVEEERWLSLNEQEEETRDEILKRAAASAENFAEIGFNYEDQDNEDSKDQKADSVGAPNRPEDFVDPDDKPYKVPKGLTLPVTVPRPETRREHAIIEKTAQFIARQGGQLEVVIRVKQKNNAQFAFLDMEHKLNLYYRFLVQQIKNGAYRPSDDNGTSRQGESNSDSDSDEDGGYLHPSLFASKASSAKTSGPPEALKNIFMAQASKTKATCSYSQLINKIRPSLELDQEASNGPTAVESAGAPNSNGTSATAESGDRDTGDGDADERANMAFAGGGACSMQLADTADPVATVELEALVAVMPPPPDVQPIVDKMAEYVAKNGIDFEQSIRAKGDPKFSFVDPGSEFYEYYQFKVKEFSLSLNNQNNKKPPSGKSETDKQSTQASSAESDAVKKTKQPNALERIALENSIHTSPERTPKGRRVEKKKMKISLKCQDSDDKCKDKANSHPATASSGDPSGMIGPLLPSLYDDEDIEIREDILEELCKVEKTASSTVVNGDVGRQVEERPVEKKADPKDAKSKRRSRTPDKRKSDESAEKGREKSHHKRERSRSVENARRSRSRERPRDRDRDRDKGRERDRRRRADETTSDTSHPDGGSSKMRNGGGSSSRSDRGGEDDELKRKQLERKKKLAAFLTMVKGKDDDQSEKKDEAGQTDLKAKIRHLKRAMADSDEETALGEADSRRPPDERTVRLPVIKVAKTSSRDEHSRHAKMNLKKLRKESLEEGELVESRVMRIRISDVADALEREDEGNLHLLGVHHLPNAQTTGIAEDITNTTKVRGICISATHESARFEYPASRKTFAQSF
ncbi:protein suppressor of white apricot-like [Tropilaelaps mercedesae]|uniref:Protein suppressor of white apricot-like n=1 Tax=Tropilaelaps mercedesae TaxID=418985 RepID=A0A1V9X1I3_9ACAR|nr:protein suppressor of white apricot-like [Tropilaelaps mercedesae]